MNKVLGGLDEIFVLITILHGKHFYELFVYINV